MKTKDSKETVKTFFKNDYQEELTKKNWVYQGTELAGEFKNFCSVGGLEIYSTMSETKEEFAERTIRSVENFLCRYMEDFGY